MSKPPLAVKDGVSPSSIWLPQGEWTLLIDFLCHQFPSVSRTVWASRISKQEVVSENGTVFKLNSPYQENCRLYYYRELPSELVVPFTEKIIFQDEHLLVVDKPHFLPVTPSGNYLHHTLLVRLRKSLQLDDLTPLHRLDRETAGLVMFSKKKNSRADYHKLFADRVIKKTYHAVASVSDTNFPLLYKSRMVAGEPYYRMREVAGETNSETTISVLDKNAEFGLYQLEPVTGKKHQLRVHMASLGSPIINDPLYPNLSEHKGEDFSKPLQLLAHSLSFIDPLSQESRHFQSQQALSLPD